MKLNVLNLKKFFNPSQVEVIKSFINFLQKKIKLNSETTIKFIDKRVGSMTTGVRKKPHNILVFCKDRLLIDVLRTLSHEWIHEYQHQIKFTQNFKHQDIGGPVENTANVLSGILMKLFQKEYPQYEKTLYNEK
jgi:hypothetical protein